MSLFGVFLDEILEKDASMFNDPETQLQADLLKYDYNKSKALNTEKYEKEMSLIDPDYFKKEHTKRGLAAGLGSSLAPNLLALSPGLKANRPLLSSTLARLGIAAPIIGTAGGFISGAIKDKKLKDLSNSEIGTTAFDSFLDEVLEKYAEDEFYNYIGEEFLRIAQELNDEEIEELAQYVVKGLDKLAELREEFR